MNQERQIINPDFADESKAKRYALWLLSRRSMHSCRLDRYLKEKGYSEEVREKILYYVIQSGLIDDSDYVKHFVSKWQRLGKSMRQIVEKAKIQSIPTTEIAQIAGADADVLYALINKRYPQLLLKEGDFALKQKAIQALLRRGFSLDQIRSTAQACRVGR